jgi:hypothetical protein
VKGAKGARGGKAKGESGKAKGDGGKGGTATA